MIMDGVRSAEISKSRTGARAERTNLTKLKFADHFRLRYYLFVVNSILQNISCRIPQTLSRVIYLPWMAIYLLRHGLKRTIYELLNR